MRSEDIKKERKRLKLTQEGLAKKLGVSRNTIKNYENGGVIPESKRQILTDILFNKETILTNSNISLETSSGVKYLELPNGKYRIKVPLVTFEAYNKYIDEHKNTKYINSLEETEFIVDKIGTGKYFAFEITGGSMDDGSIKSIPHGSIVLARNLLRKDWAEEIENSKHPSWIIVINNTILCKQIIEQDINKGKITCHSLNNSPEYADFDLELKEVSQLLNIVQKIIPAN